MKMQKLVLTLVFLTVAVGLRAESLQGVVRSVEPSSKSLSIDLPPLTRVYVNAGTRFERGGKKIGYGELKSGDEVKIEASAQNNNTFIAQRVEVLKRMGEVQNLTQNEIAIQPGQRFLLGVGQTASLKSGGQGELKLFAKEFVNTLCKEGFDCGGAGDIGMLVEASRGGEKSEIMLVSQEHRKPLQPVVVEIFGHRVQLIEVGEDVVALTVRAANP